MAIRKLDMKEREGAIQDASIATIQPKKPTSPNDDPSIDAESTLSQ